MIKHDSITKAYYIDEDHLIGDATMHLKLSKRRKEILALWMRSEIEKANATKFHSVFGDLFSFNFVPSNIGASLTVRSRVSNSMLDLTVVDDEEECYEGIEPETGL